MTSGTPSVLHLDTEAGWRGGQRQVLLLVAGLRAAGHRVAVASPPGPLRGRLGEEGIATVPWAPRGEWDLRAAAALGREVREGGWDLVHAHTSHAHALALLALRRLERPPPLVVTRRVDFAVGRGVVGRWKYGPGVARFVAVSRAVARVLERGGVPPDRLDVVTSGVPDLPPPGTDRGALRESLGLSPRQPLLLWVGHLVDHKDPLTLVRAVPLLARAVPGVRVAVAGDGELRERVRALARSVGAGASMLWLGLRDDVPDLMRAADALAVSSHMEGLSTTALDGALAGLPVVATAAGGLAEAVAHGVTGLLVPPRDPEALAAAAAAVLSDREGAARLGAAGRARVLAEFSAAAMVEGNRATYARAVRE